MSETILRATGLGKAFTGGGFDVAVLSGIDLAVGAGETVAIVGASGSGKSTLMNILGCLDRPTVGDYLFAGENVAHLDSDALAWLRREAFGFVFQGYHLIPSASAQENVEMPAITWRLLPSPTASMTTTEATPMTMPSSVSAVRKRLIHITCQAA